MKKYYLFQFLTFHGIHVDSRYPQPVTEINVKLVRAKTMEEAKSKLRDYLKDLYDHNGKNPIVCKEKIEKSMYTLQHQNIE